MKPKDIQLPYIKKTSTLARLLNIKWDGKEVTSSGCNDSFAVARRIYPMKKLDWWRCSRDFTIRLCFWTIFCRSWFWSPVYKEHHSFKFEIKNRAETTKQLDVLIHKIESMDKEATYFRIISRVVNKKMLQGIFEQYPSHIIAPADMVYRHAQLLPTDSNIQVTLTGLKSQECHQHRFMFVQGSPIVLLNRWGWSKSRTSRDW